MPTLVQLNAWRDALIKARATGVRSVQHGDTRTDFKSDDEMATAIADLDRQIAAANGTTPPRRIIHINARKGI